VVLFLAAVDNGGVTVFLCAKCGTELTPRLTALPAVPEMPEGRDEKTRRAPATVPRGHYAVESGCCGPTGTDGLNRACACGARVATLAADCFGPYELHLDPVRVYPFDQ